MNEINHSVETQTADYVKINGLAPFLSPVHSYESLLVLQGQNPTTQSLHCHTPPIDNVDVDSRGKIICLSTTYLILMVIECYGGCWANSLALILDALRLSVNFASMMIVLFTIWIASRPLTQRFNFGWYRAEVISSMMAVVFIWFFISILSFIAVQRLIDRNFFIRADVMMVTSAIATIVNFTAGIQLRIERYDNWFNCNTKTRKESHRPRLVVFDKKNHLVCTSQERFLCPFRNQGTQTEWKLSKRRDHKHLMHVDDNRSHLTGKQVWLYAVRDSLQSLTVFILGIVIYIWPNLDYLDPVLTLIFAFVVFFSTLYIIRDALMVLMESTPNYLDYNEILQLLLNIPGVKSVHNLRIWALNLNKIACIAHLEIEEGYDPLKILQIANEAIHKRYHFYETTLQIE